MTTMTVLLLLLVLKVFKNIVALFVSNFLDSEILFMHTV